jgi:hypothetical protein
LSEEYDLEQSEKVMGQLLPVIKDDKTYSSTTQFVSEAIRLRLEELRRIKEA